MTYYQDNHIQLYAKDCRQMTELADNSVQCVVTSPPYWGLRKYSGEQELIWGDNHCEHQWECNKYRVANSSGGVDGSKQNTSKGTIGTDKNRTITQTLCSICGAWKGAYGLEPTPEMYVQHTIEILWEIKRVLRKDGVVFWNIGDSYFGGGQGGNTWGGAKEIIGTEQYGHVAKGKHPILKSKDLCLIPEQLTIALQEDGWWVRSIIIWHKSNPMPESVNGWRWERHRIKVGTKPAKQDSHPGSDSLPEGRHGVGTPEWRDCQGCTKCLPNDGYILRKGSWRPTDSYERILMLTKTNSYYCDAEAVREAYTEPLNRWGGPELKRDTSKTAEYKEMQNIGYSSAFRVGRPMRPNESGRNLRNVWSFPTVPYPGAHFAVFPEKLPELCIKAATPEVGVCAKCGAPWARVNERTGHINSREPAHVPGNAPTKTDSTGWAPVAMSTNSWRPTCSCNCPDKVQATVLDPFAGAGTTLLVAKKLNRQAVGYEISQEYCELALERNRQQVLNLT